MQAHPSEACYEAVLGAAAAAGAAPGAVEAVALAAAAGLRLSAAAGAAALAQLLGASGWAAVYELVEVRGWGDPVLCSQHSPGLPGMRGQSVSPAWSKPVFGCHNLCSCCMPAAGML